MAIDLSADVTIDVSAVVMLAVGAANSEAIAITDAVVSFEFIVKVSCEVELLAGEWTDIITGDMSVVDAEVNASRLEDVLTSLGFKTNEEIFLSC